MSTAAAMNDGKVVSADHVMNASEVVTARMAAAVQVGCLASQIVSLCALPSEFITAMQATDALENL